MAFYILCQDVVIGLLFGNDENVTYKIFFENLADAKKQGLIVNSILEGTIGKTMPNWINNRIPKNEKNKLEYLRRTQGRLETDNIWFQEI